MGTARDNSEDVLGDGFVRAGEFYLLSGGDLCMLGGRLVHEVLADVDRSVFKIIGISEDP